MVFCAMYRRAYPSGDGLHSFLSCGWGIAKGPLLCGFLSWEVLGLQIIEGRSVVMCS